MKMQQNTDYVFKILIEALALSILALSMQ